MKFTAQVTVNTKPSIKDIKALTLKQAVGNLFHVQNFNCKVGSTYQLEFCAENEVEAQNITQTIAQEILTNPVIENYEILINHD